METTSTHLLDRWKAVKGIQSDNAAALALKITRSAVSGWRQNRHHADAEIAAKMAEDCGLDVLAVLAAIEADRARSAGARAVWSRYGRGAFMALAVAVSVAMPPPSVAGGGDETGHYAKRRSRFGRGGNGPRSCVRKPSRRRHRRYPVKAKAHP